MGTRALAVKTQPLRVAATAMERFPNNVACNSPEVASNIEFTSLELQRLWAVPFIRAAELHATFGSSGVGGIATIGLRHAGDTPAGCF